MFDIFTTATMQCNELPKDDNLDLSTLPKIMEHFFRVPLPQFQRDLDEWFSQKMSEGNQQHKNFNKERTVGEHFSLRVQNLFELANRKSEEF